MFIEIVADRDARHFVESDGPLLVSYVQASLMARRLAGKLPHVKEWEAAVRCQMALATKLRLAPHARMDAHSKALQEQTQLSYYDRMRLGDDR